MYKSIILHIPHSSDNFGFLGRPLCHKYEKQWKLRAKDLVDWYTDELFSPEKEHRRIIPLVFDFCRTFCDVERMTHDPLEARGMGVIYRDFLKTDDGKFDVDDYPSLRNRILRLYAEHQIELARLLLRHPGSLLIDCHSFSNKPTALKEDASHNHEVDICIGFNEDFTKPGDVTIQHIVEHFGKYAYKVGINTPYSNAKTVGFQFDYHSIMIEVNKALYMDEESLEIKTEYDRLKECIEALYLSILDSHPDNHSLDELASEIQTGISEYLGKRVSIEFSKEAINTYINARPCRLGAYAMLGYYAPFDRLLERHPEYKGDDKSVCGHNLYSYFLNSLTAAQIVKLEHIKNESQNND